MKPLEAVARALVRTWAEATGDPDWDTCGEVIRVMAMREARAALTALRDCGVTEGMLLAYFEAPHDEADLPAGYSDTDYSCACAKAEFRAMLDAALNEAP